MAAMGLRGKLGEGPPIEVAQNSAIRRRCNMLHRELAVRPSKGGLYEGCDAWNVFNDGKICMSIINPPESTHAYGKGGNWSVSVTIKQASGTSRPRHSQCPTHLARSARAAPQVLQAVQMFLDESTSRASGREEAYNLYNNNRAEYNKRVKQQVARVEAVPGA